MVFLVFAFLLIFGLFRATVNGAGVPRTQVCQEINKEINDYAKLTKNGYEIKILTAADGSRYFENAYEYLSILYSSNDLTNDPNKITVQPSVKILVPPTLQDVGFASKGGNGVIVELCCERAMNCELPQVCAGSAVVLEQDAGSNSYRLTFNTNDGFVNDLRQWGVRYYSLVLHYSEKLPPESYRLLGAGKRAQTIVHSIKVGITFALIFCPKNSVTFTSSVDDSPITSESVKIRRLAFLNGYENERIRIYKPSALLNAPVPPGATFIVNWHPSWNMTDRFIMTGDFLTMNPKSVSLKTEDVKFAVNLEMTYSDQTSTKTTNLPLTVVARAENRYNPVFISGCGQPLINLQVNKSQSTDLDCIGCIIAHLTVKDYDGDEIYGPSLEIIEPVNEQVKKFLREKLEVSSGKNSNYDEKAFILSQKKVFTYEELKLWAYSAGPKGYVLVKIKVRDRPEAGRGNTGVCVMRINLEQLEGISNEPTFISPSENKLTITIRHDTPVNTPILQVLAVDWLVQKLQMPTTKSRPIYYQIADVGFQSDNKTTALPITIESNGKIVVNGTLKVPHTYNLKISAYLGKLPYFRYATSDRTVQSRGFSSVYIDVAVMLSSLNSWSPLFDMSTQFPVKELYDGKAPQSIILTSVTPAETTLENADISCVLLDNKEIIPNCVFVDPSNNSPTLINVSFAWAVPTSGNDMIFDYNNDRQLHLRVMVTHKTIQINSVTEMGIILQFKDSNNVRPDVYGTENFLIPQDANSQDQDQLMSLFMFDRDLVFNGGFSCNSSVLCHSTMGPKDVFTFQHEENGGGHLKLNGKLTNSGQCNIVALDSLVSNGACMPTYTHTSLPLTIQITEQPINEEPIDLQCESGIAQTNALFAPISECSAVTALSWKTRNPVLRDNIYYFVTDKTGTFAANTTTGNIYLLQPIILQSDTMDPQVFYTVDVAIFNGRKWSNSSKTVKVNNTFFSRPNLVDLYDFTSPLGNGSINPETQILSMLVPQEIDLNVPILTIKQKSSPAEAIARARMPRASGPITIEPYLAGGYSSAYRLEKDQTAQNTWLLYYKSGSVPTTTATFYRAALRTSIIGTSVKLAANFTVSQASKTMPNVTIGNTLNIEFVARMDRMMTQQGLAWYWVLIIILGFVLLIMLGLLILFLLVRKQRRKVGSPNELPGSPVKFAPGRFPYPQNQTPPVVIGPVPNANAEPSFDAMLSSRLQMANLAMTSPSSGRATGGSQWHVDDGYDTVTISSGITDTPLNLSVLNQFGPEYSDLAETCGVARRV